MNYGPLGMIRALIETLLEALDPYPDKRKTSVVHGDKAKTGWTAKELSDAYADPDDDPGEKYYQDLLNQHLDEKEREDAIISEMMIADYESRHGGQVNETFESSGTMEDAGQDNNSTSEDVGETDFEGGSDFGSSDFEGESGDDGNVE